MPETSQNVSSAPETPAGDQPSTSQDLRFSAQGTGQKFEIPVLALQNLTLFPETVVPLGVGRPRSLAGVEASLATQEKLLGCITVRPDRSDDADARGVGLHLALRRHRCKPSASAHHDFYRLVPKHRGPFRCGKTADA